MIELLRLGRNCMLLSFCLITRNAERSLELVLNSVRGLGAEVIVADTGSTDGTILTARALGAKATAIAWQDDFGDAQNQALALATGEWIFWLNPDEELLPEAAGQLVGFLGRSDALAYMVGVQEVMDRAKPERAIATLQPRLFRRHCDIRYLGRLHPHFVMPLEELARREGMHIFQAGLLVRHHAYLSVLTEDKLRWAKRLLELELQDRPGQLHYLIEYGQILLRLNDPRGHTVLAEAA